MSTRDLPPRTVAIEYLWAAEERLAAAEAKVADLQAMRVRVSALIPEWLTNVNDTTHSPVVSQAWFHAREDLARALVGDETPGTGEGA